MNKLTYTLYVVSVLLISGLARANASALDPVQILYQSPVQIGQISADAAKLELLIAGSLPNPCYGNPSAMLTKDLQDPTVLILRFSSPIPMNLCVSQVKYFSTTVDLALLAQASQINLEDKAMYLIRTEGFDFEMQIPGFSLKK